MSVSSSGTCSEGASFNDIPFNDAVFNGAALNPRPLIGLAPMEGVIDAPVRALLTACGGLDFCVTEFVRVTQQVLPPRVFRRICPEIDQQMKTASGTAVHLQLLGSDPDMLGANALKAAQLGVAVIDLNFGCPAKIVNRHEGGARLLRDPERVALTVRSVVEAVAGLGVKVTAKMRLGYEDTALALENAAAIEAAGAQQLVVHCRTKVQGYRPPAHWHWMKRLSETVAIPLLANGDLWTLEDYQRCIEVGGVTDIMLGRSALANPFLPLQIKAACSGRPVPEVTMKDVLGLLIDYGQNRWDEMAPPIRLMRIKQWLALLKLRWPDAMDVFERIKRERQLSDVLAVFRGYRDTCGIC